jgi:multiple sugar transport system substrate-binding protein
MAAGHAAAVGDEEGDVADVLPADQARGDRPGPGPEYTVFAKETQTARSRTTEYGANYPKVSQAIWTAIQSAITGTSSMSNALQTAQGTISGVQLVSGG